MSDEQLPNVVFAPFVASTMTVEPDWIDYNGHMNVAYYVVLFDRAADEVFTLLGLGPEYLRDRNGSAFTAELHVRYMRELKLGTPVRSTVRILDYDAKRIHAYFEIHHLEEGWVAASCEKLFVHVDMATRRASALPDDILANLAVMKAAHAPLPPPAGAGRTIGLSRRSPDGPETRH